MTNDTATHIDSVSSIKCTPNDIYCQSKKALEIISELVAQQINNISLKIIFNAVLTRERMGSTGIGNGIAVPSW